MSGLLAHLIRRISLEGPLTIAQYMEECLGNPTWGYYTTRDPFGAGGDFTTAPEISQMFGELIGLWAALQWQALGQPAQVHLVELGPGRGTLMVDALRAAKSVPGFGEAVHVHLVEISPVLREKQRTGLVAAHPDVSPNWWNDVSQVPAGPMILFANEFFDALPIRQFQRNDDGWHERLIALDGQRKKLIFVLSPPVSDSPLVPEALKDEASGSIVEICPAGLRKAHTVAARLKSVAGAALIIDYGHVVSASGDTLQAVKDHQYHGALDTPSEADLTAHVDFQQLAEVARSAGATVFGPVDQGEFLKNMGIEARAAALTANADARQCTDISTALARLTGDDQMGSLFKVMGLQHASLPPSPGFE